MRTQRILGVARGTIGVLLPCLGLVTGGAAMATAEANEASACVENQCGDRCEEALSAVRQGTARYFNVDRALADGFVADEHCAERPGVGAMGYHFSNPERMVDLAVNVREPELLLYAVQPDGSFRLLGVEYYVPVLSNGHPWMGNATQPPPVVDNPAPVLFGRTFDGPMPGHNPTMPWHYDLHAWIWRNNPAGTFSPWNPKVTCN